MRLALIVLVLSAPFASGQSSSSASRPASTPASLPFTLGYDTTRILKPLLPDGRPDYLAALNEISSKGVTKDNNAAVAVIEVFDEEQFASEAIRRRIFEELGVLVNEGHVRFADLNRIQQYHRELAGPWRSKENPELAEWLKSNSFALAYARAAAERSRWYLPLCGQSEKTPIIQTMWPPTGPQAIALALLIRANLEVGEDRCDDASVDFLAAHRLGVLLGQQPSLLGRLSAIAVCKFTDEAIALHASSGAFSGHVAHRMAKSIEEAGDTPGVVTALDYGERFLVLDTIERGVQGQDDVAKRYKANIPPEVWKVTDCDFVLREVNRFYDDTLKAMKKPSFAERVRCLEEIHNEMQEVRDLLESQQESTPFEEWAGDSILSLFIPVPGKTQVTADLVSVERNMTLLALGLCAYKADNGKYPGTLDELAPKYLQKVPEDFCSGKPFIYKKTGQGYILYSVGENMKDDGGKTKAEGGDDLVVKTPPPTATQP